MTVPPQEKGQLSKFGTSENLDELKVTFHNKDDGKTSGISPKPETNLDGKLKEINESDNEEPAQEPHDVLLKGKSGENKEPRFFDKIKEGMKQKANEETAPTDRKEEEKIDVEKPQEEEVQKV